MCNTMITVHLLSREDGENNEEMIENDKTGEENR